jgi:hypothetical protein
MKMTNYSTKFLILILSIVLVSSQVSCSLFATSQQTVKVTASEDDADIFINGHYVGKGIGSMKVPRDQSVSVMAKKEGFIPATDHIETKLSMLGILDIFGGAILLIPFIGLAGSGSRDLSKNNVSLILEKEK